MTTRAASESVLGELHRKIAKVMSDTLTVVEVAQDRYLENDEAVEPPAQVSAALLSVMVKFLADNSITAAPEESTEMSELEKKLQERKNKRQKVANVSFMEDYT